MRLMRIILVLLLIMNVRFAFAQEDSTFIQEATEPSILVPDSLLAQISKPDSLVIEKEDGIFNIKKKKPMILTLQQLQGVAGATDIYNLIRSMLCFVPEERPTATAVLNSSFFSHPSHSTIGSETIAPTDFKPVGKFPSIYFLYILNFPN